MPAKVAAGEATPAVYWFRRIGSGERMTAADSTLVANPPTVSRPRRAPMLSQCSDSLGRQVMSRPDGAFALQAAPVTESDLLKLFSCDAHQSAFSVRIRCSNRRSRALRKYSRSSVGVMTGNWVMLFSFWPGGFDEAASARTDNFCRPCLRFAGCSSGTRRGSAPPR